MDADIDRLLRQWVQFDKLHLLQAGTLNTATFNVGQTGLTRYNLQYILWFMQAMRIDVFFLQDTRLLPSMAESLMKVARTTLGPGSVCKSSAGKSGLESAAQHRSSFNERVGGQVILVAAKWGLRVVDTWTDPSDLGVAMSVTIDLGHTRAMCMSTYFPVKPADTQRGDQTLWRRVRGWMRAKRQHGSGRSDPLR